MLRVLSRGRVIEIIAIVEAMRTAKNVRDIPIDDAVMEQFYPSSTSSETRVLRDALLNLSEDERSELTALMLLGRGSDFSPGDLVTECWDYVFRLTPVSPSAEEQVSYLMGKLPLADYLREGLSRLALDRLPGDRPVTDDE